jgi:pectate lyase
LSALRQLMLALLLASAGTVSGAPVPAPGSSDYYIEARFRALQQSGRMAVFGRHTGASWAGVELTLNKGMLEVHATRMREGTPVRLRQMRRIAGNFARHHLLRLELEGTTLAVYLDGERLGSVQDASLAELRGPAGFNGDGDAFEIDQVRTGPASDKPARIALSRTASMQRLQAGDAARLIEVSALAGDGLTPIPLTARSTRPAVARVAVNGSTLRIIPLRAGTAEVVLASAADPRVRSTLSVVVGERFAFPGAPMRYPTSPRDGAAAVPVDTLLRIHTTNALDPAGAGSVRIYRKRDMRLVDVIHAGEEVAAVGPAGASRRRYVKRHAIAADGALITVRPHSGVLEHDTAYVAAFGKGVAGKVRGRWTFRTRKAPQGATLSVDDDGPADFMTVQGALDHAMSAYPKETALTIEVRNGRYQELLFLRERDRLTIRGESRDGVVIEATNNEGLHPGSGVSQGPGSPGIAGGRALMLVEDADLLTLESLTLRNATQRRHSLSGQAETIFFNSDKGRLIARNASFFSEQDTLQLRGYAWFHRTLVAGNVDFIWGANRAALFEQSEIRSIGDSANADAGGYIVQARTVQAKDPGFVFLNSTLTQGSGPAGNAIAPGRSYLARSPGTPGTWDNVSYINCAMDRHIAPVGWAGSGALREPAPNPARADATQGWREFGSTDPAGQPLDLSQRRGGYLLTPDEAHDAFGSRARIFAGFDGGKGWDPQP